MTKLKLAKECIAFAGKAREITNQNEMLLFTGGLDGEDSVMAREYFEMKQKEVVNRMRRKKLSLHPMEWIVTNS